jgi:hypothetical protein
MPRRRISWQLRRESGGRDSEIEQPRRDISTDPHCRLPVASCLAPVSCCFFFHAVGIDHSRPPVAHRAPTF